MIYQDPLAYLLGLEGIALLDAWAGDHDRAFTDTQVALQQQVQQPQRLTPANKACDLRQRPSATSMRLVHTEEVVTRIGDVGVSLLEPDMPWKTSHDKPGKPVPNQVPTTPAGIRCRATQCDSTIRLTCRNATYRYFARRNRQAWHARGQGFESPKLHDFSCTRSSIKVSIK